MVNFSRFGKFVRHVVDIALLGLVAVLVFVLVFPGYEWLVGWITSYLDRFYIGVEYAVWVGLATLLVSGLWYWGGIRWRDFYTFRWRLPIWKWAVILTVVYLYFVNRIIRGCELKYEWWHAAGALIFVNWLISLVVWCYRKMFVQQRSGQLSVQQNTTMGGLEDFYILIKWLEEEKPIEKPSDDRFGMDVIARRIGRILRESPLKTVGLLGSYGCGKSSILNMVEYYLHNLPEDDLFGADKMIVCRIDSWGLRKESAEEVILERTVNKLSQYIDCVGLAKVPDEYRNALSDVGPWWWKFISAGLKNKDATKQLEKLDNVLIGVVSSVNYKFPSTTIISSLQLS